MFQENVFSSNNEYVLRNENSKMPQSERKKALLKVLLSEVSKIEKIILYFSLKEGHGLVCVDETVRSCCSFFCSSAWSTSSCWRLRGMSTGTSKPGCTQKVPCAQLPSDSPCQLCGRSPALFSTSSYAWETTFVKDLICSAQTFPWLPGPWVAGWVDVWPTWNVSSRKRVSETRAAKLTTRCVTGCAWLRVPNVQINKGILGFVRNPPCLRGTN